MLVSLAPPVLLPLCLPLWLLLPLRPRRLLLGSPRQPKLTEQRLCGRCRPRGRCGPRGDAACPVEHGAAGTSAEISELGILLELRGGVAPPVGRCEQGRDPRLPFGGNLAESRAVKCVPPYQAGFGGWRGGLVITEQPAKLLVVRDVAGGFWDIG
ncbi:hypothetical protein T484DRAFT_1961020 [Baffinella frigidus]|nr:hypothetical protein T484DRAFT_1961020 [Cryptophyta sp. CCMP2293]